MIHRMSVDTMDLHGDDLAKGSMGFPLPVYVSESQGRGCMSNVCAFVHVSVNVQALNRLVGRRSDGPSGGVPGATRTSQPRLPCGGHQTIVHRSV